MLCMDKPTTVASTTAATATPLDFHSRTIDAAQCAALLFCSVATIENLATRGDLPATKYGRGWVFVLDQVMQLVRERASQEAAERRFCIKQPKNQIHIKSAPTA